MSTLLEPDRQKNDESENIPFGSDEGLNPNQQDYDQKFDEITGSPENVAFGDQADASARSDEPASGFKYTPDKDRAEIAENEASGSGSSVPTDNSEAGLINYRQAEDPSGGKTAKKGRSKISALLSDRRTKGGILGGGIVGILVGGFIGLPPFQLLHIAQSLQNWHFWDDNQTGNWSTRRIIHYMNGNRQYNNLSIPGNKLADRYENRLRKAGVSISYEHNGKSRATIQHIDIDPDNPQSKSFLKEMQALGVDVQDIDLPDGKKGHRVITRGKGSSKLARNSINTLVDRTLQMDGISASVAKRILKKRSGVNLSNVLRNLAIDRAQDVDMKRVKRQEKERLAKEAKNGVDIDTKARRTGDTDADGKPLADVDPDGSGSSSDIISENDGLRTEDTSYDKKEKIKSLNKGKLAARTGGAAVAIVGLSCAAIDIGEAAEEVQHAQTILPMIRLSMQLISGGAQMQAGQNLSADSVAAISEAFYDAQADPGTEAFFAAAPVQAEMGKPANGATVPESAKPGKMGDEPGFLTFLKSIPGLTGACSVQGWVEKTIGYIPGVTAAQNLLSSVMNTAASGLTGKDVDEWVGSLVNYIAGESVDTLATGAELGALATYGAKLASNDAMMSLGGIELSGTEKAAWNNLQKEYIAYERKQQSLFTRMVDLKNPYSLSSIALLQSPAATSPTALADSLKKNPTVVFTSIANTTASILTPKAYAQSTSNRTYDYGFNDYGFSKELLEKDEFADPYCNAAYIRGTVCMNEEGDEVDYSKDGRTDFIDYLPVFNDNWGECFGNPVDDNGKLTGNKMTTYENVNNCKESEGNINFQRYTVYLLDRGNATSVSCYENLDEDACIEVGIKSASSASSSTPTGGSSSVVKGEDTSGMDCAAGFTSERIVSVGSFSIKLCDYAGVRDVNASWSVDVSQMLAAARADGLELAGGGFRTHEKQIELRKKHCGTSEYAIWQMRAGSCKPPTAIPGTSNHELGLAIDFNNCSTRGTACYKWLAANAGRFNIKNLPSEPWHWSFNGS